MYECIDCDEEFDTPMIETIGLNRVTMETCPSCGSDNILDMLDDIEDEDYGVDLSPDDILDMLDEGIPLPEDYPGDDLDADDGYWGNDEVNLP